jgi:hypothetical protein
MHMNIVMPPLVTGQTDCYPSFLVPRFSEGPDSDADTSFAPV